jgi:hypothetical protein
MRKMCQNTIVQDIKMKNGACKLDSRHVKTWKTVATHIG